MRAADDPLPEGMAPGVRIFAGGSRRQVGVATEHSTAPVWLRLRWCGRPHLHIIHQLCGVGFGIRASLAPVLSVKFDSPYTRRQFPDGYSLPAIVTGIDERVQGSAPQLRDDGGGSAPGAPDGFAYAESIYPYVKYSAPRSEL